MTGVKASGASFERASLHGARFIDVVADYAVFEYADLRTVQITSSVFDLANFVGADLSNAQLVKSSLYGADFFLSEMNTLHRGDCDMEHTRMPQKANPKYGPSSHPPAIQPVAAYREAMARAERQALIQAALSEGAQ